MRVLHVLNYGWPHVDGYTARARSLVTAQVRELDIDAQVAVGPYRVFAPATDPALVTEAWGPEQHELGTVPVPGRLSALALLRPYERPALGLAPFLEADVTHSLNELLEQVGVDVVHAHHPAAIGRPARAAARRHQIPFVYELRCFNGDYDADGVSRYERLRGHRQNALELALCRSADAVVTISEGLAERIVAGGVPREKVTVVRNAVDTTMWQPMARTPVEGRLTVGYATTFEAMEGLDQLVEAVGRVRSRLPGLRVVLAGAGRDWDRIRGLVDEAGLAGVVELPGFLRLPELRALYGRLDLFVVPRRPAAVATDTTPLKPLEALAVGLPVLATDLPALRELLAGRDGVRHVASSPEGLAEGLLAFNAEPWTPTTAPDLGDRAWSGEVHRYTAVYDGLVP